MYTYYLRERFYVSIKSKSFVLFKRAEVDSLYKEQFMQIVSSDLMNYVICDDNN
jgi:hypothetical protein